MEKGKKSVSLTLGILLIMVLIVSEITGWVTRNVESMSKAAYRQRVDSVAFGYQLKQDFVPQHELLDTIQIHVDASGCARDQGVMQFTILDQNSALVFCTEIPISELPQFGWAEVPVHTQLSLGQVYTLVLESVGCLDNGPAVSFVDSRIAATTEQQGFHLVYADMEVQYSALQVVFGYQVPIKLYEYPVYFVFGMLLILLLADLFRYGRIQNRELREK